LTDSANPWQHGRVIQLEPICAFTDNYVWLLRSRDSDKVAIVDPGEASPVLRALEKRGLTVAAILLTHHHEDHVGGVGEILEKHPAPVYGPAWENISTVDHPVRGGDRVPVEGVGLELDVVDVPGHTTGHIAYLGPGFALVGDTLFAGGCGRIFEGTPEQMYASLLRLAALAPDTAIYCAHEYTAANLRFAVDVEPDNSATELRFAKVRTLRGAGRPTVPSTLSEELQTNPFLRCREPSVVAAAEARVGRPLRGTSDVFAVVRRWKDGWRG
jgi:hydroxyacylglutathione hydrolase